MAQKLIVEGNDAIALASLCQKKGLPPPLGYDHPHKFRGEFVANAGSCDKAIKALALAINQAGLNNIGIIVDANDAGPEARWQSIRAVLAKKYSAATLDEADGRQGPKIISEAPLPRVGVWIMPDNASNGYLEHFLARLIPPADELWRHAQSVISDLRALPFNELPDSKEGKATLHSWLAWKKEPGKPFGQAIAANQFDLELELAASFFQWFSDTFELTPDQQ